MELNVKQQGIEVNQLLINKKHLTKSRLLSLPKISYMESLNGLMTGNINVVARFPIELYVEACKKRDTLLGTISDQPPKKIMDKASGYYLVGILLYEPKLNALLTSWFVADEYVTTEMDSLHNIGVAISCAEAAISGLSDFSVGGVVNALDDLEKKVFGDWTIDFIRYLGVCAKVRSHLSWGELDDSLFRLPRGRARKVDECQFTVQETQAWFDSSKKLECGEVLNPEWITRFLMTPYHHTNWWQTRRWIVSELKAQRKDIERRLGCLDASYNSVMSDFKKSPVIFV